MDRSYVTENAAERERLKALVARLTDDDMARAMSPQWTVGVGLMHLAFWDGMSLSKFEEGLRRLQGCHVQIVLRELQTLAGHPDRLHVWTQLAKEAAAKWL